MEKRKTKINDALSFKKAGQAVERLKGERDELLSVLKEVVMNLSGGVDVSVEEIRDIQLKIKDEEQKRILDMVCRIKELIEKFEVQL